MNKYIYLFSAVFFTTSLSTKAQTALQTSKDSLSYALGVDIAKSLKRADFDVDLAKLFKGLELSYKGESVLFDDDSNSKIIQTAAIKVSEQKTAALKKEGENFLAANKARNGIKVTPEGVQYEVIKEGAGAKPTGEDEVVVHYVGSLVSGDKFDSSYDRGEPLSLKLNNVIEGWKIGIPLMTVGSKYKFYIPYNLAYGERATGMIPSYSALIFEVELLNIKQQNATP